MARRKTPEEKHAYHAAEAERHRVEALIAADPFLKQAIALRTDLQAAPPESDNARLLEALSAFIDGRTEK